VSLFDSRRHTWPVPFLDWLTWVRVDPVGVDGLGGGLPVALRREAAEPVDPDGGYAGHGRARGGAGACR